jgi:protein SCO1/2
MTRSASGSARPGGGLRRNPYLWATVAGLILIPAMRPLLRFEPSPPPLFAQLPDFHLIDQQGRPFERSDLDRQVTVAAFFSTQCRAECPQLIAALSELEARYRSEEVEGVGLVGISVEPTIDTPEVLLRFAEEHRLDLRRWSLLTGSAPDIRRLVLDGFRASEALAGELAPAAAGEQLAESRAPTLEQLAHLRQVVLIDPRAGIRGYYRTDEAGLDEVFHRSLHVLRERRPPRRARWPAIEPQSAPATQ